MTLRWRIFLAFIGLLLLGLAAALALYGLWPVGSVLERVPVEPTLFAPPQAGWFWLWL
jgi:hypothetical protein